MLDSTTPNLSSSDEVLIDACLKGDPRGWAALVRKYQRLIYSVASSYRLDSEDSADVFQAVCIELYKNLKHLRSAGAVRSWLSKVASRECARRKVLVRRAQHSSLEDLENSLPAVDGETLEELERQHLVREALSEIPERCRRLIQMLFYEDPPRPYAEVAKALGLALGSIGFIRGRCLQKMERALKDRGL